MKKTIVLLTSLLLISCSTSETEILNESNSKQSANSSKTIDPVIAYESPYDISRFDRDMIYKFEHITPFQIKIKAHVGLAYIDDSNPGSPDYLGFDLSNGHYPLLYSSSLKYGNTIASDELILPIASNGFGVDSMIGHFPISGLGPNTYPQNIAFSFSTSGATIEELKLLYRAGKIYYMSYEIFDKSNNPVASGYVNSGFPSGIGSFGTLPSNWSHVGYDTNFSRELISETNSKEIVVTDDLTGFGSVVPFIYNGNSYQVKMFSDPNIVVFGVYPN
jgi:hypothetical protein